jgi:hypothetical protein
MATKIYGASDDLIEIDGDCEEEANIMDAENVSISASDGTTAKISYEGNWIITVTNEGILFKKLIKGSEDDDCKHTDPDAVGLSNYSDVLVLNDGIEWVKIGRKTYKK